jgi:hypothetical protein
MSDEVKIKLTQIYLEIARSFLYSNVRSKPMDKLIQDEDFADDNSTFIFGLASITTLYSYLAIEAFANYGVYELWKYSLNAKERIDELNKLYPDLNAIPIYKGFSDKYGEMENFADIRKTNLRELKERIKELCKEFHYPQIHEAKPQLWNDFTGLLEQTRHFVVHPNPEEKEFQKHFKTLIQNPKLFVKFPDIAANIISYFYESGKKEIPEYLTSNKVLMINEVILLK